MQWIIIVPPLSLLVWVTYCFVIARLYRDDSRTAERIIRVSRPWGSGRSTQRRRRK